MNAEKEREAINRLQAFEPRDGEAYYLCYSGGKDSDVIRILAQLAGVRHEIHHNLTTVDAPETMQYLKTIPGVIIDKARYDDGTPKTMWNLIPRKMMPPTRIARWCCAELKETGGAGRLRITGVRWAESVNRRDNADVVRIIGKPKTTIKRLQELGINFKLTNQGGVVLSAQAGDNDALRDSKDFAHHCYHDRSVTINPIVDWTDRDVWDFLHHYGCEGNPLYKCGKKRVGCIGCPLATKKRQRHDLAKYQKYRQNYINAFERMIEARKAAGKGCSTWKSGEDVLHWWISDNPDQLQFFSDDELLDIMEGVI